MEEVEAPAGVSCFSNGDGNTDQEGVMDLDNLEQESQEVKINLGPYTDFPLTAIHRLCDLAKHCELKIFRLVSRKWNRVVTSHCKYFDSVVKFGKAWGKNAETMDIGSTTTWKFVTFRYFNFLKQQYFPTYWAHTKGTVQKMRLESIRVHCHDLANLINSAGALTSITFNEVHFEPVHQYVDKPAEGQPQHGGANDVAYMINCSHTVVAGAADVFAPTEPIGRPSIETLVITKQEPLPICVLHILRARCRGTLVNFKFERYLNLSNKIMRPTMEVSSTHLIEILCESQDTVRKLAYLRNDLGSELVVALAEAANFPRLNLVDLEVFEDDTRRGRDQDHRIMARTSIKNNAFQIMRNQQLTGHLRSISVGLMMDEQAIDQLQQVLVPIASLRKLKLEFFANRNRNPLRLGDFIAALVQLEEFILEDAEYVESLGAQEWRFQDRIDLSYLTQLPAGITSLGIAHLWDRDVERVPREFFQRANTRAITKFHLTSSKQFDDVMMQSLIGTMTQLEELTITYAPNLTDFGLTGIDRQTCSNLINCSAHSLMAYGTLQPGLRRSLADLRSITKLNFCGCKKLSDVSCRFALSFPKLKYLDLSHAANISDIGINWLGENNPMLQELVVRNINRISHFGLNLLISNRKSIRKIITSETTVLRKTGNLAYAQHALFNEIVQTKRAKDAKSIRFTGRIPLQW